MQREKEGLEVVGNLLTSASPPSCEHQNNLCVNVCFAKVKLLPERHSKRFANSQKEMCKSKTDLQIRKIFSQIKKRYVNSIISLQRKTKGICESLSNIDDFRSGIWESILYLSTKNALVDLKSLLVEF